jgi:hypothetical protein
MDHPGSRIDTAVSCACGRLAPFEGDQRRPVRAAGNWAAGMGGHVALRPSSCPHARHCRDGNRVNTGVGAGKREVCGLRWIDACPWPSPLVSVCDSGGGLVSGAAELPVAAWTRVGSSLAALSLTTLLAVDGASAMFPRETGPSACGALAVDVCLGGVQCMSGGLALRA